MAGIQEILLLFSQDSVCQLVDMAEIENPLHSSFYLAETATVPVCSWFKPIVIIKESLDVHNGLRKKHGVSALTLSKELCKYAQEWADHLVAKGQYMHRPDNKYGENICSKWSSAADFDVSGKEAVEMWYSEIKDFTFGKEPADLRSGHFTQVVWAASKELGIGKAKTKDNKIIVVANYNPPGNLIGHFAENCPKPK